MESKENRTKNIDLSSGRTVYIVVSDFNPMGMEEGICNISSEFDPMESKESKINSRKF